MKTKVTTITAGKTFSGREMRTLYEAAGKTFTLPPWDAVQKAIVGDADDLRRFLIEEKESLANTPFSGPTVWMPVLWGAVEIHTEGGLQMWVTPEQVGIDFTHGSILEAEEIIGRIWADDPGGRLDYSRMAVFFLQEDGDSVVTLDEYVEPSTPDPWTVYLG
jgi:hypothetical protein